MRIIIPWILASLLIAYFGRRRTGGFWGMLFFSLILSPLLGLLALIVAGPSKRAQEEERLDRLRALERQRAARMGTAARTGTADPAASTGRGVWRAFAAPWILLLVVFTLLYWVAAGAGRGYDAFAYAGRLSVEAGTLGLVGDTGHAPHTAVRALAAIQRMGVLLLLAAVVMRLAARRQDLALRSVRTANDEAVATVHSLERDVQAQRREIDRLRGEATVIITPGDEPATAPPAH